MEGTEPCFRIPAAVLPWISPACGCSNLTAKIGWF